MNKYRKLVAAGVGMVVMVLATVFGVGDGETLMGMSQETLVQLVVGGLTALGVWGFKNEAK